MVHTTRTVNDVVFFHMHISNKHGCWNKHRGGSTNAKLQKVEGEINFEARNFILNQ